MSRIGLVSVPVLLAAGLACDATTPNDPFQFDTGLDVKNPGGTPGGTPGGVDSDDPVDSDPTNPGTNRPPRANAGPDLRNVTTMTLVDLDGSASSDVDGDELFFSWELVSKPPGSTTTITNPDFEIAQVYIDRPGTYRVELTVDDGIDSHTDSMQIIAESGNGAPVANAGQDQRVNLGNAVTLSGASSSDPDNDPLEYNWRFLSRPPGSAAILTGVSIPALAQSPSFIADAAGLFTLELTVFDGMFTSPPDIVSVTVVDPNSGGSSSGGSSSGSDCLSCAAEAGGVARASWTTGGLASSFGLLGLPVLLALWHRRRDED